MRHGFTEEPKAFKMQVFVDVAGFELFMPTNLYEP